MSLWTKAALGVAAVVACANGAAAQQAGVLPGPQPGCATCGKNGAAVLRPAVPDTIPHCSKHDGLTQYPLSEKRYIKQFCHPTICPNSCFGHFKTQWTAWPNACPGWPQDGPVAPNTGPNTVPTGPINNAPAELAVPKGDPKSDIAPKPADLPAPKAMDPAPKAAGPALPPTKPLDRPSVPRSPLDPPAVTPAPMPPVAVPPLPGPGVPRF